MQPRSCHLGFASGYIDLILPDHLDTGRKLIRALLLAPHFGVSRNPDSFQSQGQRQTGASVLRLAHRIPRMANSSSPTLIPVEILLKIFDLICFSDEISEAECRSILSNLALVCHTFNSMAIPQLFQSIEISSPRCGSKPIASFCAALVDGDERAASLASHVKLFLVGFGCGTTLDEDYEPPNVLEYVQAAARMPNLESLGIGNILLDENTLKELCGIQQFVHLIFQASFDGTITEDLLFRLPSLRPKHLWYISPNTPDLHSRILLSLISSTWLETFLSVPWSFTRDFLPRIGKSDTLTDVSLAEALCSPVLWTALEDCNALRSLRIARLIISDTLVLPSRSTMPNLHTLYCPPILLSMVSGRPLRWIDLTAYQHYISHVDLIGPPMQLSDIDLLKQSMVHIEVMHLPSHLYFLAPFEQNFPFAAELHLSYNHRNFKSEAPTNKTELQETIYSICRKWPPNYSIHMLNFDFGPAVSGYDYYGDAYLQYSLLCDLHVAFPNLRHVNFVPAMEWDRVPFEDDWKGRVPRDYRDNMDRLETWSDDAKNTFASLILTQ